MKNPLSYQTTEYDCGPTTLLNAMRYLFKREEIPPDIIKHISLYSLDSYNDKGESGKNGTSSMAMLFLSEWLNKFGKIKNSLSAASVWQVKMCSSHKTAKLLPPCSKAVSRWCA